MLNLFSFLRKKQEARITLETIVNPISMNGERELKAYVELTEKEKVQFGPYRLADAENINEAAGIVLEYLSAQKFEGNVVIYPMTTKELLIRELFQSDFKYRYKKGKVEVSGVPMKGKT
ncbi:MAG: hypothetical protein AABW75_00695 [Nanoarchaeota archaeon]